MARKAPSKLRKRVVPIAAALGVGMAAFAAVAIGLDLKLISALRAGSAAAPAEASGRDAGADKSSGARPVYPYSIIPGGAETVDELQKAISTDPVVAAHFAHFDLSKTRVETLKEPKVAHVSYRKGQDVFWTSKPVQIPAGERVLTDGTNVARVRCGNCLSDRPGAVSAAEPDPGVLDTPQPPSGAGGPPSTGIGGWSNTAPPGSGVGDPGPSSTPTGGGPGPGNSPPGSGGPSGGSPSGGPGPGGQSVDAGAPVGGVTTGGTTSIGGIGGLVDAGAPGETTGPGGPDNSGNGPASPGNSGNSPGTGGSTGPGNPSTGSGNPGGPGDPAGSGPGTPSSGPGNPSGNPGQPSSGGGQNPPSQPPGATFSPDGGLPPLWLPPGGIQPPGGSQPPGGTGITPPGLDFPPAGTLPPAGGGTPPGSGNPGGAGDNPEEGKDPRSVPEPGTTALMLLGGAWMLRKRVFTSRSSR